MDHREFLLYHNITQTDIWRSRMGTIDGVGVRHVMDLRPLSIGPSSRVSDPE